MTSYGIQRFLWRVTFRWVPRIFFYPSFFFLDRLFLLYFRKSRKSIADKTQRIRWVSLTRPNGSRYERLHAPTQTTADAFTARSNLPFTYNVASYMMFSLRDYAFLARHTYWDKLHKDPTKRIFGEKKHVASRYGIKNKCSSLEEQQQREKTARRERYRQQQQQRQSGCRY